MSGDLEQEYFCDGISDDIITELSRFRSLFVIARNSIIHLQGTRGRRANRREGVGGSLRSLRVACVAPGCRLRLTAPADRRNHGRPPVGEKYDREVTQIFDIQEELTQRIVVSIAPFIDEANGKGCGDIHRIWAHTKSEFERRPRLSKATGAAIRRSSTRR
jgi:TolB-like protein